MNKFFNYEAFMKADTKTQTEVIGFTAKAMRNNYINEAVKSGDYIHWKNAVNILENTCNNPKYYFYRKIKQVENVIRIASRAGILAKVPVSIRDKDILYHELERQMITMAKTIVS